MKFANVETALNEVWGYDKFRPGQEPIVDAVMRGDNGMVVLATGGGKSVCFQAPALTRDGVTVVVSPLIALMQDQVGHLKKLGVPASAYYHDQPLKEVIENKENLESGRTKLLYVSPERLQNEDFLEGLKGVKIASFAIDEAHCASIWGHDFRPAYTKIGQAISEIEQAQGRKIQRFAFTATADDITREDVVDTLGLGEDSFRYVGGFDRPNIEIDVRKTNNKFQEAVEYARHYPGERMIFYSATIRDAAAFYDHLHGNGIDACLYHGQMNHEDRVKSHERFSSGKVNIMIATKAYGMGIDIEDIRHIGHLQMPGGMEDYAQEMGRAGRDGKPARAVMFPSDNDRNVHEYFIRSNYPKKELIRAVQMWLASQPDSTVNVTDDSFKGTEASNKMQTMSDITGFELKSSIRILEQHGALSTLSQIGSNTLTVELVDIGKDIDLSYLDEKRLRSAQKLSAMERFVNTSLCRRNMLLKSFGERPANKAGCGNCDSCLYDHEQKNKFSNRLPNEVIDNALKLINGADGKLNDTHVKNLLLGTVKRSYIRRGWDKIDGFGSLSSWTTKDVDALVDQMAEDGLVKLTGEGRIEMTNGGTDWLAGAKKPMVASKGLQHRTGGDAKPGGVHDVDTAVSNEEKKAALEEFVQYKAGDLGVADFMVMSREMIEELASDNRPLTQETLKEAGLTQSKLNLYGDELVEAMKNYSIKDAEKTIKKEIDSEVGFPGL